MTSESGTPREGRPWTLLLGPGERLEAAFPLFQGLLTVPTTDDPATGNTYLEQLEDLGALICEFPESGRLLLDADSIPLEDVGLVRRFRDGHPSWELHLVGSDPGRSAARALRQLPGSRWWPAPLEVESLYSLATPGAGGAAPCEAPAEAAEAADEGPDPEPEAGPRTSQRSDSSLLARVEAILGSDALAGPDSASSAGREDRDEEPAFDAPAASSAPLVPSAPPAPAPYFKHQVADLADLVQRIELVLARSQAESEGAGSAELQRQLDELASEVLRLKQFARTLAYLAAPPAAGSQRFELAPMIEELLTARRSEPGSPRYLVRTSDPLAVRSDKALLAQVFDALLYFSHHLAGPEGTVRVDGRLEDDPGGVRERVRVSIRFPATDHPGLDPAKVLEPYGLRRILPELGANALAAAAGILRGQGGSLELVAEEGGGFEWILRLPHAD